MNDLISRQAAIEAIKIGFDYSNDQLRALRKLPSVQPEQLTDKEQRIFLAAMEREEEVCKEVDKAHTREAYEDSLMYICKEIKRKVKGALWMLNMKGD